MADAESGRNDPLDRRYRSSDKRYCRADNISLYGSCCMADVRLDSGCRAIGICGRNILLPINNQSLRHKACFSEDEMSLQEYREFISRRKIDVDSDGFEPSPINHHAKRHQDAVIRFALDAGKSAAFLDTGLGKSLIGIGS